MMGPAPHLPPPVGVCLISSPFHWAPATLALWLFLSSSDTPRHGLGSGPLHLLYLLPGMLFPQVVHGGIPLTWSHLPQHHLPQEAFSDHSIGSSPHHPLSL